MNLYEHAISFLIGRANKRTTAGVVSVLLLGLLAHLTPIPFGHAFMDAALRAGALPVTAAVYVVDCIVSAGQQELKHVNSRYGH